MLNNYPDDMANHDKEPGSPNYEAPLRACTVCSKHDELSEDGYCESCRYECYVCRELLMIGEHIQAFLRCPEDPNGSWTEPVELYCHLSGKDGIRRKHHACEAELKGRYDGKPVLPDSLRDQAT